MDGLLNDPPLPRGYGAARWMIGFKFKKNQRGRIRRRIPKKAFWIFSMYLFVHIFLICNHQAIH